MPSGSGASVLSQFLKIGMFACSICAASLLLGMNDGRSEKVSRPRPDSFSSFPRQKRSARQRFYFLTESESE